MTPYTDDQLEAELRTAIDGGDLEAITRLSAEVDRREAAARRTPVSLHAAALWYAEQGLRVFPLSPGSKIPFKGSAGCKDATVHADIIDGWWTDEPEANIGVATGHLVDVVDIDGLDGQASRAQHWAMFEALRVIGTVCTPRPGGMHLYVPASGKGNKAGILPGVDYRGVGGYVVAPPSRTEQGTYRFLRPLDLQSVREEAA